MNDQETLPTVRLNDCQEEQLWRTAYLIHWMTLTSVSLESMRAAKCAETADAAVQNLRYQYNQRTV